jgi:hypothetical protein
MTKECQWSGPCRVSEFEGEWSYSKNKNERMTVRTCTLKGIPDVSTGSIRKKLRILNDLWLYWTMDQSVKVSQLRTYWSERLEKGVYRSCFVRSFVICRKNGRFLITSRSFLGKTRKWSKIDTTKNKILEEIQYKFLNSKTNIPYSRAHPRRPLTGVSPRSVG